MPEFCGGGPVAFTNKTFLCVLSGYTVFYAPTRKAGSFKDETGHHLSVKRMAEPHVVGPLESGMVRVQHAPILCPFEQMSKSKDARSSSFGVRLREAIRSHPFGVTFSGFATLTEIPYRSLQNYLRDEREPSASALTKMAAEGALNVTWLLTGEGEMYLPDYMKKTTVDKVLILFMPQILDQCLDPKKRGLTTDERKEIIGYMWRENHLGLGDSIRLLIEDYDLGGFEELADWLDYLKDCTAPHDGGD